MLPKPIAHGFDPINHIDPLGTEKKGFVGDPGGRDPRDPQLDGGATMVVSAEAHVDDSLLDQMACQYLNDCKTNNLAALEDKHTGSRPRNVPDESSPSSRGPSLATPGEPGRSPLVVRSLLEMLTAQVLQKQRVVLLLATNLDVVTPNGKHPQEGKNQRKLFRDFEKRTSWTSCG